MVYVTKLQQFPHLGKSFHHSPTPFIKFAIRHDAGCFMQYPRAIRITVPPTPSLIANRQYLKKIVVKQVFKVVDALLQLVFVIVFNMTDYLLNLSRSHEERANIPIANGNTTQNNTVRNPGHVQMTIYNISMHHKTIPNIIARYFLLSYIRSVS